MTDPDVPPSAAWERDAANDSDQPDLVDHGNGLLILGEHLVTDLNDSPGMVRLDLLARYMEHVNQCEGSDFVSYLGRPESGVPFADYEQRILAALSAHNEAERRR